MTEAVLDASAVLALINAEPGADLVLDNLPGAVVSSVNFSEVVAKLNSSGVPEKAVRRILEPLGLRILPFDTEQAYATGFLQTFTRPVGLSFGDRACLNLGKKLGIPVLTADKTWKTFSLGVEVRLIR
jgi:ribonuclease VapC